MQAAITSNSGLQSYYKKENSMKEKEALRLFYAVTKTSVYSVSSEKAEDGITPIVEKLAVSAYSPVGVGLRLMNGSHVAITGREGIMLYFPQGPGLRVRLPEDTNTRYWGGHTSNVVALFLDKDAALACSKEKGLRTGDPRWWNSTQEVLDLIGDDHPTFIIAKFEGLRLERHAEAAFA